MSLKSLSDYTFYSRYSHYLPENKRRETWAEAVERVFDMHKLYYKEQIEKNASLVEEIDFAESQQKKKRVLAAQRTLQFGGAPILKHNVRLYNCSATHIDRQRVFAEALYVLLCGCGVGFSVQYPHISKLPNIKKRSSTTKTHVVGDSIEGWSDAVGVLMASYFDSNDEEWKEYRGKTVIFDYSEIRPKGSLVANQFLAPGPEGLFNSMQKIESLIESRINSPEFKTDKWAGKLKPINCYDIIMHIGDAVLSGGVRRSATLCLFSLEDKEMATAKTGDWFIKNPQRGRSNNSAALLKGEVTREQFGELMKSTKEFGEPGFVWLSDVDICYNPCLTGDTVVITDKGEVTIKEIVESKESYNALSYNTESGHKEYKKIECGIKTKENTNIIKIELEDGKILKCTPDHRVFTKNRGYVMAAQLVDTDEIVTNGINNVDYVEVYENTVSPYIKQDKWTNRVIKHYGLVESSINE